MTSEPYKHATQATGEDPGPVGYLALVLAWVVPGLGHFLLGQKARGMVFALTIHGLFAGGMLLGGLRAINPPEQPIWTYTQFLSGWPMLVANHLEKTIYERHYVERDQNRMTEMEREYENNDRRPSVTDDTRIEERKAYARDFIAKHPLFAYHPKVQDVGAVYCGIAGMLNLLVMFDVLLRITGSQREEPEKKSATPPAGEGMK